MKIPPELLSKKLGAAVATIIGLVLEQAFNLGIDIETKSLIAGVVMAYLIGQGFADLGKGRVQEEVKHVEAKIEQVKEERGLDGPLP